MMPGSTPSTPPSAQLGTSPGRRRLRIQAAVARTVLRREHRRLSLEAEDAAVDVRLPEQHARVVDEIARREIVGAVDDDVVRLEELRARSPTTAPSRSVSTSTFGIDRREPILRRRELRPADVGRAVQDLPLQVAEVDDVEVDDADACRRRPRRDTCATGEPSPPAPMQSTFAGLQLALTVDADLRHDQVAAVALDLLVRQLWRQLRLDVRLARRSFGGGGRAAGDRRDDADRVARA